MLNEIEGFFDNFIAYIALPKPNSVQQRLFATLKQWVAVS
jgi:hypothetical protein